MMITMMILYFQCAHLDTLCLYYIKFFWELSLFVNKDLSSHCIWKNAQAIISYLLEISQAIQYFLSLRKKKLSPTNFLYSLERSSYFWEFWFVSIFFSWIVLMLLIVHHAWGNMWMTRQKDSPTQPWKEKY